MSFYLSKKLPFTFRLKKNARIWANSYLIVFVAEIRASRWLGPLLLLLQVRRGANSYEPLAATLASADVVADAVGGGRTDAAALPTGA